MTRRIPRLTVVAAAVLTLVMSGCGAVDRAGGDAAAQARTLRFAIAGMVIKFRPRRTLGPRTWNRTRAARSRSSSCWSTPSSILTSRARSSPTSARGPSTLVGSGLAPSTSTDTTISSHCWRPSWWIAMSSRPGCSMTAYPHGWLRGSTGSGCSRWACFPVNPPDHEQGRGLHRPVGLPGRQRRRRRIHLTLTTLAALGAQIAPSAAGQFDFSGDDAIENTPGLGVGQPVPVDVAAPHRQREPLARDRWSSWPTPTCSTPWRRASRTRSPAPPPPLSTTPFARRPTATPRRWPSSARPE